MRRETKIKENENGGGMTKIKKALVRYGERKWERRRLKRRGKRKTNSGKSRVSKS